MSSRLFTEVREKRGLCYTVYATHHTLRDRASVLCYAGTSADRAQETLDVMLGELVRLAKGIEPEELNRLESPDQKRADHAAGIELVAQSSSIARDWFHLGRVRTLDEVGALVDGLTCESINAYLAEHPPARFHHRHPGIPSRWRCRLEFLEHKLSNGLEIVAECNAEAHSTAVGFFVETGARDETDELAGVSHFLEHMVFKGTPTRSADDVNREFDEMGAHYNAFTSEENTVYYAAVLPEHQTAAVELLADILRPSLRDEDFNTEKKVILEEIKMYEDQPPFGADDKCKAAHFGSHPLGRSVLGTVEIVGGLSVDAMRDYFRRRYSPGNITLVGSGRDRFRRAGRHRRAPVRRLAAGRTAGAKRRRPRTTRAWPACTRIRPRWNTSCNWPTGPTPRPRERFAAKILATVLGDDSGSRLYWALVDSGLAEHASLNHYDYQGTGLFMTYMTCEADRTADNLAEIAAIYRQAEAEGILPAELNQAKSKINSRVVLSSERPRGRLFTVGGNWLQRREYRSVADDLAAVDAVSVDDVGRRAERNSRSRSAPPWPSGRWKSSLRPLRLEPDVADSSAARH